MVTWVVQKSLLARQEHLVRLQDSGLIDIWVDRSKIDRSIWCQKVKQASQRCIILGMASYGYREDPHMEETIRTVVAKKVPIEIYFFDPTYKEILEKRAEEEKTRITEESIRRSIKFFYDTIKKNLSEEMKSHFKLFVYRATPTLSVTLVDDYMIVSHYLATLPNEHAPSYHIIKRAVSGETLFEQHMKNVEDIQKQKTTEELTDENIKTYT